MRRLLVACMLLVGGWAATADSHHAPPSSTTCWNCHGPGADVPHMDPPYLVTPLAVEARVGQPLLLKAQFVNTWSADLRDIYVTLDLSHAPSLAFIGTMEPVDATFHGNITAPLDASVLSTQRASITVQVPPGSTDVRVRLAPTATGPTAPDLALSVYGPRGGLARQADEAGPGEGEVVHIRSATEVAGIGYGAWRIEAQMRPVGPGGASPGTQWGFTVRLEAWGNASLERQQVAHHEGIVLPGQRAVVVWPLVVQAPVDPGETVAFTTNATAHYDHQGSYDDWANFTLEAWAGVRAMPDGAAMGLDTAATIPMPAHGVRVASVSEAIGYAAAMLLVTSMVTGGMFGKTSRRHLNLVFGSARRRVAFHNFLSYGIVAAALAHMALFVIDAMEPDYPWQRGMLLGGVGILCMLGLGVTGAMQVSIIRRWNYATWRWVHLGLALATVASTVAHVLLDGAHFSGVQDAVGWRDPLVPESRQG